MKERIEESWTKIEEYVSSTADFAIEQAPLVAQEIVAFGRVWNSLVILFCVLAVASVAIVYVIGLRYFKRHNPFKWDTENFIFASAIYCLPSMVILIPSLVSGFSAGKHAVMAWFAPRLYIIEYIADKISG